jgi:hypothetical protein
MTFRETVRSLRIERGFTSRDRLADECSGLDLPDGQEAISVDRIDSIEEGRAPRDHEIDQLAAVLFEPGDRRRSAFIAFAHVVQRYEREHRERRAALRALLADAADLLGGRLNARTSPRMYELRIQLGDLFEDMADTLLVVNPTMEIEDGPRLALVECARDGHLLDLTLRNEGAAEATSIAMLLPGSLVKRGAKSVPPRASIEIAARTDAPAAERDAIVQYADRSANAYLQRASDPSSRLAIQSRVIERPKTWWDVNAFIVARLGGNPFRFGLAPMDAPLHINDPDPRAEALLGAIAPSERYAAHGFARYAPENMKENDLPEVAFMSPVLNDALWHGATIAGAEDEDVLKRLELGMKRNAPLLADVLVSKYARLRGEQRFFNEEKLCLGSDIIAAGGSVSVFRGTYFHGFLTNELATKQLSTNEPRPEPVFSGARDTSFLEPGTSRLADIAASGLSNHVGASVLLLTGDGRIQFWRQAGGEHGIGKAAATGSGSCDWEDWADLALDERDVAAMARSAMVRELREESGLMGRLLRAERIECRLLAYFRWARRGGKPEFVGIARTALRSDQLWPDQTEVDAPSETANFVDARDCYELTASIDEVLRRSDKLSLPLWVGLTCLRARCTDADCADFLWPHAAARLTG